MRVLVTVLVMAALVLLALWAMRRGWANRRAGTEAVVPLRERCGLLRPWNDSRKD